MTRLARRDDDDVILREVAGQVFLVPVRGRLADLQDLFVLNEVGAWIWHRLDGSRTPDDLARELAAEFDVELDDARADVQGFLADLAEADVLSERPE